MAPVITEEELEIALQNAFEELKYINLDIAALRSDLDKSETIKISWKLEIDRLKEELRTYRIMYPNLCKRFKEK